MHGIPANENFCDFDNLFTGGRTTSLVDTIAGLDDFDLIAFLVVQG